MYAEYLIDIKKARQDTHLTLEQAAEAAEVSLESWKAYEYGQRIPPRETMARICEALNAPWLALEWLRASDGSLGVLPEGITVQALPTAALQLISRVWEFADRHRDRQLMAIAQDGRIDADEWGEFQTIVDDLDGIIQAALQVKFTNDQELPGKKRTAPTRERRRGESSNLAVVNDCRTIISHRAGIAIETFARRGGASL